MKFKTLIVYSLIAATSLIGTLRAAEQTFLVNPNMGEYIQINNRILAKINGKAISLVDVVNKMDVAFHQQYPQYADMLAARYTYYTASWRNVLQDLIDKELILADAKEVKLKVSHGDVRQEMEELFGPHIMETLNSLELSYEEAWDMVQTDILIRRMMLGRVNMKAMAKVNPKEVRRAYHEYAKQYEGSDRWVYYVVSVRASDAEKGQAIARHVHDKLVSGEYLLETLNTQLRGDDGCDEKVVVNVSEECQHTQQSISPAYKEVLATLEVGSYSPPVTQQSRVGQGCVHRIFFMKDKIIERVPSLQKMENELKNQLLGDAIVKETNQYIDYLHRHFGASEEAISELIPSDFVPFSIN